MTTLIILGGLPGNGKTALARVLAKQLPAAHLRVDAIEQALLAAGSFPDGVGPLGYVAAQRLAVENLRNGLCVVADSVNPVAASRAGWRAAAAEAGAPFLEVEVICSDTAEHRRRIETRAADIPGHRQPTWADVQVRDYEPWDAALVIDTAGLSSADAAAQVIARL
ncbi:AAA family ATPase [Ferrovibrio xuzhouensis]|uniref:AAA family ATPase n=1 Tax=Ferrovibrio xuzhouensis TaxID=1576914 RepID=A0ABV7VDD2_9PROT